MWNQIFGVGDLDGAAFTKLVAKEGVKRGVLVAPEIDPDAMVIRDADKNINLGNVHLEFLMVPRRKRLAYVREHVLQVVSPIDLSKSPNMQDDRLSYGARQSHDARLTRSAVGRRPSAVGPSPLHPMSWRSVLPSKSTASARA